MAFIVAGSLYFLFDLRSQVSSLSKDDQTTKAQLAELTRRVQAGEASDETLAQQVGMTKKELAARAADLQRQTRAAEARLAAQQKEQISQVTGEVAGVKTDVGGVKTDVASTRSELEATKARLERTIGDLGLQSGLIARTRDDLEVLKHRGDRNYYEFTGFHRQPATEKGRCEKGQVHHERHRRRSHHREKRSQRQRAHPVLHRARTPALRIGCLDRRQEKSKRLPQHSKERPGTCLSAAVASPGLDVPGEIRPSPISRHRVKSFEDKSFLVTYVHPRIDNVPRGT